MITYPSDLTQVTSNGTAPHGGQNTDTIVVAWNKVALQAIRDTHPGPPMVARMLAVVHTCMFDAWAAYDEVAVGTRMGGLFRRPLGEHTPANKTEATSYAAYRALADLFPTQVAEFDAFLTGLGYSAANVSLDPATPAGIGNRAARQVLAFRHNDGSNQLGDVNNGAPYSDYTEYAPVNTPDQINDPNRWQPLRVSDGHGGTVTQHYIAPHWGLVIPFALTSGSQFRPTEPVLTPADPDEFKEQCAQVLVYSANLTHTQKVIAEYWADGPSSELPPGHWCLFAQYVSERDAHDLDADTKMFFALTNAIFDASISAWDAKRAFDSVRPVTAIHHVFKGRQVRAWGGPNKGTRYMLGEKWQPYQAATVVTPPFPEYISGHSIFSAAGAEILTKFTGSDAFGASVTVPAGSSAVEPGTVPAQDVTLAWPTFADAAAQAGLSRRYGGIHFAGGDLVGRALGRVVAEQAWDKAQAFITGSA